MTHAVGQLDGKQLKPSTTFSGPDVPSDEDLYKCIHCGLCLDACPTYLELGLETESPRGRIALMKAVAEDRIGITDNVIGHWDLCLQCRACEAVCPSGVPFGRMMEASRAQVEQNHQRRLLSRWLRGLAFRQLLPHQGRLELLAKILLMYQKSGLQRLIRGSQVLRLLPMNPAALEKNLPSLSSKFFSARGQVTQAQGEMRARVALLSGCIMPLVHQPTMEAVVRVLSRNGCEVVVPQGQGCCGALNAHSGELESARRMARRNVDAFLDAGVDAVIVASAGCGSTMKEYEELLKKDSQYAEKVQRFSGLVKDIHEFLASLPLRPPKARLERRVTYQDSCHLVHAQRISSAPRTLLKAIPGLELVEMSNPDHCCGAAGSYSITQRQFSLRLLDTKMSDIATTETDVAATANPGCVLQLQLGARRAGLPLEVRYVIDLLDEAYALEDQGR